MTRRSRICSLSPHTKSDRKRKGYRKEKYYFMKKSASVLTICILLICCTFVFPTKDVQAGKTGTATDTITIKIGYLGWTEDQYITKATYHWTELDDQMGGTLDTFTQTYSRIKGQGDNYGNLYLSQGRGFLVRDLFEYANMDFGSIASVNFTGTDGFKASFNYDEIFGNQKRYYFPNLASNEELGPHAADGGDIWAGATPVEPMLALEDYSETIEDPDVSGYDFEEYLEEHTESMGTQSRFHLLYGQATPYESRTNSLTKYCNTILVLYRGKPLLTSEETNIDLKVGSGHKINLTVEGEESTLDEYVKENITWSSDNTSVATVDQNGYVKRVGEGETTIRAKFGESEITFVLDGNEGEGDAKDDDTKDDEPEEEIEQGYGNGNGTGNGDGTGNGSGNGKGKNTGNGTSSSSSQSKSGMNIDVSGASSGKTQTVRSGKVFAINPEVFGSAAAGSDYEDEAYGGKMDDDSEQLKIKEPEEINYAPAVGGVCAGAVGSGALLEIFRFRRLRGRTKKK